jgi:hypothetical protein
MERPVIDTGRKKLISKLFVGLLIAAAVMVGIYAAAATTATNMAASFTTAETTGRTRLIEFAAAVKQASAERKAARAICELLTGAEKNICNAEANAEQKRAKTEARVNYKGSVEPPANSGVNEPKTTRDVDVALYRVHRQLPD